jgi:DNA (cytosine-5)-methyltransferase 1
VHELALFAGAGGGILGGKLLGWRTRCAVEIDPYARSVLLARQRDGHLEPFPIWDDIRTFDGKPWRGTVDVVSGGFPCQDISSAGKHQGLAGERSGLWFEMFRVIGEVQPSFVFAENSPHLRTNGLGTVIEGLASLGYDCRWCVLGAWHAGGPHRRNRMWIFAYANNDRERILPEHAEMAQTSETSGVRRGAHHWWEMDCIQGMADGLAHRMDRVRATGNGQVPIVAAMAWQILSGG